MCVPKIQQAFLKKAACGTEHAGGRRAAAEGTAGTHTAGQQARHGVGRHGGQRLLAVQQRHPHRGLGGEDGAVHQTGAEHGGGPAVEAPRPLLLPDVQKGA